MTRISNNITIFLKIFVPTFWFVFFTSFLVAIFFVDGDRIPLLASTPFRIAYTSVYLIFALLFYFTIMRLKRVDMDTEKMYVSNYLKTYAYPITDLEKITLNNYGLFRTMTFHLKSAGSFGKKIKIIPSYKNYQSYLGKHSEIFSHLTEYPN